MKFQEWPKIYRLKRDIIITEKIDGTNAQILIQPLDDSVVIDKGFASGEWVDPMVVIEGAPKIAIWAGSRTRWLQPGKQTDNFGFAGWVNDNVETLIEDLGPGRHYGEWWGAGIQRKYGQTQKFFSLFNTTKWKESTFKTPRLGVVPVLYEGPWFREVGGLGKVYAPDYHAGIMKRDGSKAAPGFMDPEGIVVFHTASNTPFKFTLDGDGHKG